jgi:hypothetical protein
MSEETKKEENKAAWSGLDASRVARIKELESKVASLEELLAAAQPKQQMFNADNEIEELINKLADSLVLSDEALDEVVHDLASNIGT